MDFEMSELHEDLTLDAEIEEYHLAWGEGIFLKVLESLMQELNS